MNTLTETGTLPAILQRRAQKTPDRPAYVYFDESAGRRGCTYAELLKHAGAISGVIRNATHPGDRVLLLYPPGLDFIFGFFGSLCAGTIAVPAPPPNRFKPERSLARLATIVESARPKVVLTTAEMLTAIEPAVADNGLFARMRWVATDNVSDGPTDRAELNSLEPHPIAMLQYTSGSTADPKGAALSQANILHNVAYFDHGWEHTTDSILVNWLPAFHDLGLFYGIICPLWGGFLGVQMSPIDVIQRPLRWLRAISEFGATHSVGPNFIYDLCCRKVRDEEISHLDLSRWKMALTAAEPIRAETMTRFAARFAAAGFRYTTFCPGYGMSECTCKIVAVPCSEEPTTLSLHDEALERNRVVPCPPGPGARTVVACGRPAMGTGIAIVDPDKCIPRGPDEVGEIWISGASVAHSYWEQPQATEASLRARLAGGNGTHYLRSGDLGFIRDGQVYVTGRLKDLIIVRGANHYPQDLEFTAQEACPHIRPGCCAAFSYEEDGEERVALVAEVERRQTEKSDQDDERRTADPVPKLPPAETPFDPQEIVAAVRTAISESHGLRIHRVALIRAGSLLKTTSGKIQRQACKQALLAGKLQTIN